MKQKWFYALNKFYIIEPIIRKFNKCDFFLKFVISVRGDHFDYAPRAPKSELRNCACLLDTDKVMCTSSDYKMFVCSIMWYCGLMGFVQLLKDLHCMCWAPISGFCVRLLLASSVPKHIDCPLHSPTKLHTLMNDFPCINFIYHIEKYFK